ncbi:MAG: hypothetical protein Q8910_19560, partial [Bacteroidota bacterium]|nr:hypothetical protein [Bacteroidota bacterium]
QSSQGLQLTCILCELCAIRGQTLSNYIKLYQTTSNYIKLPQTTSNHKDSTRITITHYGENSKSCVF